MKPKKVNGLYTRNEIWFSEIIERDTPKKEASNKHKVKK